MRSLFSSNNPQHPKDSKISTGGRFTIHALIESMVKPADVSTKRLISLAPDNLETKYWLSLLKDTEYIDQKTFDSIYQDADEIGKILFSILKKTKINQEKTVH